MKNIWMLAFGLLMILCGFYALLHPGVALMTLALYLGIAATCTGIVYIMTFPKIRSYWALATGILNVLIGVLLIGNLGITTAILPFIFGFWVTVVGFGQMMLGFQLKDLDITTWGWRVTSGLLGVVLGTIMLINPVLSAVTMATLLGVALLFYGALDIGEFIAGEPVKRRRVK